MKFNEAEKKENMKANPSHFYCYIINRFSQIRNEKKKDNKNEIS